MSAIVSGRILQLAFLLIYGASVAYGIFRSVVKGIIPKIHQPATIQALEIAVGRCVETGRPLLFQTGIGDVTTEGATHMAMLSVLNYTARLAAQKDAKFICTTPSPTLYPLAEAIVQEAFLAEGKPDKFASESVQYLSDNQMGYCSAVMHLMKKERIAANVQIGFFQAENLITLEAAEDTGAINIGGAVRMLRLPDMAVTCDYFLIGEEVFAAGAFCSRDALQLGSLLGQDICKWIALAVVIAGTVLVAFGSDVMIQILKL